MSLGCSAMIRPAASSWQAIRATSRPNSIGSFAWWSTREWYAAVFPELRLAKETGLELVTSQGGSRYATSVGGTLTGRGADLIIVDDPLNANEVHSETARKRVIDWYGGALVSRLNDKQTGPITRAARRATTKNNENQSVCDRFSIVYLLYRNFLPRLGKLLNTRWNFQLGDGDARFWSAHGTSTNPFEERRSTHSALAYSP